MTGWAFLQPEWHASKQLSRIWTHKPGDPQMITHALQLCLRMPAGLN